jgi:DNA mismatch endonuclease (patch repair protein)
LHNHHLSIIIMTDIFTKEQRSYIMSRIKSKNTRPELIVRKYLYNHGIRYRLHTKLLPGSPDIMLKKYGVVIFVNGCFWHGHDNCSIYRAPKTNSEWWKNKIGRNIKRDKEKRIQLRNMGWHVITVWECQLKPAYRQQTLEGILLILQRIYLSKYQIIR